MDYDIRNVRGHYEVFSNGEFICSGDTVNEAIREAEDYLAERG